VKERWSVCLSMWVGSVIPLPFFVLSTGSVHWLPLAWVLAAPFVGYAIGRFIE